MGTKKNNKPTDDPTDDPTKPGGRLDPTRLIAESGNDAKAALQALVYKLNDVERDNAKYRGEIRELKAKMPEGSMVLEGDELKAYQAYKEFGSVEDLKKKLDESDEMTKKLSAFEEAETLTKVAKVAGVNYGAFSKLYKGHEFTIEGEGDDQKVFVKEGDTKLALSDHIEKNNSAFKASLFESEEDSQPQFPKQTPKVSKTSGKITLEQIQEKKAATGQYSAF